MALNTVQTIDDRVRVRTALVSVWDKTGLPGLVNGLLSAAPGLRILSTGGTHEAIQRLLGEKGSGTLQQVSDYTGQPEMQGGLVKTLDFRIYLGLLAGDVQRRPPGGPSQNRCAAHRSGGGQPLSLSAGDCPVRMPLPRVRAGTSTSAARACCARPPRTSTAWRWWSIPPTMPARFESCRPTAALLAWKPGLLWLARPLRHLATYDRAIAEYLAGLAFPTVRGTYVVKAGV